ncbi:MAG: cysteine hydrolase [Oscillospiraceae bacterium]|nr:cysteine hydrolase [Oscillospiraceae bacterium]
MRKFSTKTPDICRETVCGLISEIKELSPMDFSELVPEKTALIVVDVINGFIREGAMSSSIIEGIVPNVVKLMEKFKDAGIPVAAFADCHSENCAEFASFPQHCLSGTSESELVDELKEVGGYFLIKKNSTNGFHEKDFMHELVRNPKINTFVVVGDCTDICVMQLCLTLKTWFTAQDRTSEIIVPMNCVETYDSPDHNADFMNIAAYKLMKDSGIKFVSEIK